MRKEVSCRIVEGVLEYAEKTGVAPETVCAGLPSPLDYLRDKQERIEWDVYRRMVTNLRAIWSDDDFFRMGFEITRSTAFRGLVTIARLLYTGPEIYSWRTTGANSPGRLLFSCTNASIEWIGKNRILLTLTLSPGYQHCRKFFVSTRGSLTAGTMVVGLGPARVEMRETDQSAVW